MAKAIRASQAELEAAVDALRDGELVAFPTETVYGLGANAANPAAVRKVFELKGRPPSHPLIVHIDQQKYLKRWVREVMPVAEKLAEAFWPGPLTLVLPRSETVHDIITGGQDSIAIRIPSQPDGAPAARCLRRWHCRAFGQPLRPPVRPRAPSMCWMNSAMP